MHQGSTPRCDKCTHHFAALDLRQENHLAAIGDGKIHGFAAVFHQSPHIGSGDLAQITVFGKGIANTERLHANEPQCPFAIKGNVAFVLHRGQQSMGG